MTEFLELPDCRHGGVVAIARDDSVWITTSLRWWMPGYWLLRLAFWGHKASWLVLNTQRGRVRVLAVRLATRYVRLG